MNDTQGPPSIPVSGDDAAAAMRARPPAVKARLTPPSPTTTARPRPAPASLVRDALGRAIAVGDRVTAPVGGSGAEGIVQRAGALRVAVVRADGRVKVVQPSSLIVVRQVR
jgi:hypothetical protein